MKKREKPQAQLIEEVSALRARVTELEALVSKYGKAEETLSRLAAIIESSDDAIISTTLDGIVLSWNTGAERIYGYAAGEIIGRSISLLVPPDRPDEVPHLLERIKRSERVDHYETVRVRKDGKRVDVSLAISPIRGANGALSGAATIARDITGRKLMEESLRESEERYRYIFDHSLDGIMLTAPDGQILAANPAACRMLGRSEEELCQVGREGVVDPTDPRGPLLLEERARTGRASGELSFRRKDGSTFPTEQSSAIFRDKNGSERTSLIFRDISERKRAEETLRGLLEAAPDAMVVVGKDGGIRFVNSQTERLFGYTRDELLGQSLEILVPERFRTRHQRQRADYFTHPHVRPMGTSLDLYGLRKDGTEIPIEVSLSPLETAEGIVVTGAIRDITERKQAEEALREEAAISAALVQVGQGLIASLDTPKILDRLCQLTTEVLDCDCSYTALWHAEERVYKAVAAYGNTPEQWEAIRTLHVPPMAVSDVLARLERERVIEIGKEDSQQLLPQSLLRQFGMTAVLYLALWRGAELVGIQSAGYRGRREFSPRQKRIAQGISQLASLVLANAKLLEELEGANRIKEDFIGTMSHELRTPLNVIIGYTDLLLEGEFGALSSEQTNILKRVDKSSRELLDLVGATLDLSRLQSRQDVSVHMQEVNVTALLEELEGETLRLNDKPTVILHWQIPQELPMLLTDPVKLKMVLKNLVTNALKFTQEGAVTVVARLQDEGVEFSVMDTGIGIAPENLQSIFDPFHQLNGSSTRRHGGVGLGLYIVRQLLKLLGGTISVESEVGRGSTFRVWVPRRQ